MYQQAKGFMSGELDRGSSAAGAQLIATAAQLRTIEEQLRGDDIGRLAAPLVARGATALESAGKYLEDSDADRLLSDAEKFGRERPWAVALAAFAVGMAGSRMIKATGASHSWTGDTRSSEDTDYRAPSGPQPSYMAPERTLGTPVSSDAAPTEALRNTDAGAPR